MGAAALAVEEQIVYQRPESLHDMPTHYCPGCTHGIAHRLVAEVLDELGIREKTILVAPVGCSVLAYQYFNVDSAEAAHGRAPAMATGIKRILPDHVVFTYQGDGDLASIGIAETMHAANRGENLTCIFINNAIYGMTGGQMAPTTLIGQKTATSPQGRSPERGEGFPIKMSEILSQLDGVVYAERTSVATPKDVIKARQAIRQAFLNQMEKKGFSIVEILSQCPTIWGLSPAESVTWVKTQMEKEFPVGRIK